MTQFSDLKYIDLHTHTTASDGSMTPADLVRYAYNKGLAAVAVTDHDTVDGIGQAIEEGDRLGIEVIAGVEISVDFSSEVHLLGYFLNGHCEPILRTLKDLRERRETRNPRIVNKLNELGFDITMEEVSSKAEGGNVGRPHIARVMIEKGYVNNMDEAFEKYLGSGRPAYFKKDKLLPKEGIAEIIRSGGIPVLAHPFFIGLPYGQLDQLVKELTGYGLKGIEAYYSLHTEEQTSSLLQIAQKYGLLVTGGSDFHGSFKPDIEIGTGTGTLKVPYSLLAELKQLR
jgi:predicted metal-dependent phosphoesterase TrpH